MTVYAVRVFEAVRQIPAGEVRTYAQIAKTVGGSGSARGVATCLRSLGFDSDTPWWRVVRSDGSVGSSFSETVKVLSILALEGVEIEGGKVKL